MNDNTVNRIITGGSAVAGILCLWLWLGTEPTLSIQERVPGMDMSAQSSATDSSRMVPEGELIRGDGVPAQASGSWPWFRGNDLDNISKEQFEPVPKGTIYPQLWSIEVGEGFASAAIHQGCVYLMDYDRENEADAIRCLSLADGREIWRYTYPVRIKRNHGMSRTIPSVTNDVVVTIGPKCHVTCLDAKTGEKRWAMNLVQRFGAEVPPWYAGQCPLIDGDRVILAPGGSALLAAVDLMTGEVVWESANPNGWKMTHSSVMPMEWMGRRMYVYCASGGVTGISAEDGRILWETPEWTIKMANVPSPLIIGEGRIFLSGGYLSGSMMLQLEEKDGQPIPQTLFRLKEEQFGSTQHTPIFYNGFIYGVRPDGQLVCLDLEGKEKWTSTSAYKFGLGPYTIAGTMIYVMNDSGLLSRVEATPDEFRLVDQVQVLNGHDAWGPMAFASGRMILRDLTKMVCLMVAAKPADRS